MNSCFVDLSLTDLKDIATIFGVLVALATLVKGAIEYVRQGALKRAELFMSMHRRFKEDETLDAISEMLEKGDPNLVDVPFRDKSAFLCFFEEIALMMRSNLIRKDVAHYMFGYYALRCWESDYFWSDVNRDGSYWALFRELVKEMSELEKSAPFKVNKFAY